MQLRRQRRRTLIAMVAALMLAGVAPANATDHTEVLYSWAEFTEGVAVDNGGNIYVSNSPAGELWKFAPGAAGPEVFGQIDGINTAAGDIGLIGLAVDRYGNIYGAVSSPNGPDAHGVWKFNATTGQATKLPGSDQMGFPNSVGFDGRGQIYATDTALGAVWRFGNRGQAEVWVQDDSMLGTGALGIGPIGANGIAVVGRTVYVSVTEQASIVSIPINRDGSAGPVGLLAAGDALFAIDGIAAAADGSIYAGIIGQFSVVRVHPDGTIEPVASAADGDVGILDVSSVAFGTTPDTRKTLYGVNFGFLSQVGTDPRPGLVAIDVGVPGQPIR